jgi:hypothetical protein
VSGFHGHVGHENRGPPSHLICTLSFAASIATLTEGSAPALGPDADPDRRATANLSRDAGTLARLPAFSCLGRPFYLAPNPFRGSALRAPPK